MATIEELEKVIVDLSDRLGKLEKMKTYDFKKAETKLAKLESQITKLESGLGETQVDLSTAQTELDSLRAILSADDNPEPEQEFDLYDRCRELTDRLSLLETAGNKLHAK